MLDNLSTMEVTTTEEKFHAAVELIKNLPKSGSFQPSNELKLKFYSYFKQATEGPCELSKPSFWDVVNRAKWDAWNKLGNMSKEDAMKNYVQEFVKILEETPLDDPKVLDDYVHIMGPYICYAPKEYREKTLLNGKAKLIGDKPGEPIERNNVVPAGKPLKGYQNDTSDEEDNYPYVVNGHNINGSNESDSEEFSDTLERVNESDTDDTLKNSHISLNTPNAISEVKGSNITTARGGGEQRIGAGDNSSPAAGPSGSRSNRSSRPARSSENPLQNPSNNVSGSGGNRRGGGNSTSEFDSDAAAQLALAIIRLQHTVEQIGVRMESLEKTINERLLNDTALPLQVAKKRSAWSLFGISPKAALIILAWPVIVQWLIYIIRKRNRRL